MRSAIRFEEGNMVEIDATVDNAYHHPAASIGLGQPFCLGRRGIAYLVGIRHPATVVVLQLLVLIGQHENDVVDVLERHQLVGRHRQRHDVVNYRVDRDAIEFQQLGGALGSLFQIGRDTEGTDIPVGGKTNAKTVACCLQIVGLLCRSMKLGGMMYEVG